MRTFFKIFILILVLALGAYAWWDLDGHYRLDRNKTTIIVEMRRLSDLVGAEYSGTHITKIERDATGLINYYLFSDRLSLSAEGSVRAGIDLSQLREEDVQVKGVTVTVTLPPAKILSYGLNTAKTSVDYRDTAVLAGNNLDMETVARQSAESDIVAAACAKGILDMAATGIKGTLTTMLQKFGFEDIRIMITAGPCVPPPQPVP
jgi:hypothetical protein